jgi:hypothetical protein
MRCSTSVILHRAASIVGSSPHEHRFCGRSTSLAGRLADYQGVPPFDADARSSFAESLAARLPGAGPIVFFSAAVPLALKTLAVNGTAAARRCAGRLESDGIDVLPRIEAALGPPSDGSAWTWETLAVAAAPLGSSIAFVSRREAAAAYVTAIDRATPRSRRDAIAAALARYGRANLAALSILAGIARVGPRV